MGQPRTLLTEACSAAPPCTPPISDMYTQYKCPNKAGHVMFFCFFHVVHLHVYMDMMTLFHFFFSFHTHKYIRSDNKVHVKVTSRPGLPHTFYLTVGRSQNRVHTRSFQTLCFHNGFLMLVIKTDNHGITVSVCSVSTGIVL